MRLIIDTDAQTITTETADGRRSCPLYSPEGFALLSRQWLKVGWNEKYTYTFTWLGRPIIQLPDDMFRLQEVIWQLRPQAIVETGVAHGGSLVYYASLCELLGGGRVIGVELALRPSNRAALDAHPLRQRITLVDGGSTEPATVARVRELVGDAAPVLVLLDSAHDRAHVLAELEAYHSLVTPGSYLVATDGIMRDLTDVPRGDARWATDNPAAAAEEFAARHPAFVLGPPPWAFNESPLGEPVTHWPSAWLQRRAEAPS